MKNIKKGVVLIYVLFLVTLAVVFSTVLLSNNNYLFNITEHFDIESKLYSNINSDWKILVDITKRYNNNGNWFIDNVSCPEIGTVSMSWTTLKELIWTNLVFSWSQVYCEWIYNWNNLKLYFNEWFTDIPVADYNWSLVWITNWVWNNSFWDIDSTYIDFSGSSYLSWDWIDDDFNSDNYKVTSTWNILSWIYYPLDFVDDDNLGRKVLFGLVSPNFWYKKVFWNTSKVLKIIDKNTNNDDLFNIKLWDVTSGVLNFDIDNNSYVKILRFDKNSYDNTNELILLETLTWSLSAGIGYLQNNLWVLSLSVGITWNEHIFDFKNNNYAVFLKANSEKSLLYKIKWETTVWTWIYITPIDDSWELIIKYQWWEILLNSFWEIVAKENEIFYKK